MSYTNVVFQQNITKNVNRDEIQRQRLDDRVGFQSRFQTAGNLIFKPEQQSTLHVDDRQRFNKNHDTNDRIRRQRDREREDRFYDARLNKRMQRDQQNWEKQQVQDQREESKRLYHQELLLSNRRNTNGYIPTQFRIGYNPITQTYEHSERGQKLKNHDESKQVNRYVRSRNVVEKNNRDFNIITGENKQPFQNTVPQKLQERVNTKYEAKKQKQIVRYQPIKDKYDYLDDE